MEEYHKPRVLEVEGSAEELIGAVAKTLFDHKTRYLKLELESEGTLFYRGKLTVRF